MRVQPRLGSLVRLCPRGPLRVLALSKVTGCHDISLVLRQRDERGDTIERPGRDLMSDAVEAISAVGVGFLAKVICSGQHSQQGVGLA